MCQSEDLLQMGAPIRRDIGWVCFSVGMIGRSDRTDLPPRFFRSGSLSRKMGFCFQSPNVQTGAIRKGRLSGPVNQAETLGVQLARALRDNREVEP